MTSTCYIALQWSPQHGAACNCYYITTYNIFNDLIDLQFTSSQYDNYLLLYWKQQHMCAAGQF